MVSKNMFFKMGMKERMRLKDFFGIIKTNLLWGKEHYKAHNVNDDFDYRSAWFWILFALILLVIGFSILGSVYGIPSINPGNCSIYNLSKMVNCTTNTSMNVSVSGMFCCDNCTRQNITLSLGPNETTVGNINYCFYNVSCGDVCPSACTIDKSINPGEEYERKGAGCDVEVRCDDCPECEFEEFTSTRVYTMIRESNTSNIVLKDEDDNIVLDMPFGRAFTYDFDISYVCPSFNVTRDLEGDISLSYSVCKKFEPYMYNLLLLQEDGLESRDNRLEQKDNEIKGLLDELSACEFRAGRCTGESTGHVSVLETKLNASDILLGTCTQNLAEVGGGRDILMLFTVFSFVGVIILGVICVLQSRRLAKYQKNLEGRG